MYAVTLLTVFCCFQRCKNTKVNCVDGECTVICSAAWSCSDFQVDVSYGANLILLCHQNACYNVDINKYSGNNEDDTFVGMWFANDLLCRVCTAWSWLSTIDQLWIAMERKRASKWTLQFHNLTAALLSVCDLSVFLRVVCGLHHQDELLWNRSEVQSCRGSVHRHEYWCSIR